MAHANTVTVGDNSFESPSCNVCYDPNGTAWTFTSNAGILGDGNVSDATPDGAQQGWFQYTGGAEPEISQALTGFTVGDVYDVSFAYAERNPGDAAIPLVVAVNLTDLGTYTPSSLSWSTVTTASFVATQTSYTLSFTGDYMGTPSGEADTVIDLVQVTDVGTTPEPASFLLIGFALIPFAVHRFGMRRSQVLEKLR